MRRRQISFHLHHPIWKFKSVHCFSHTHWGINPKSTQTSSICSCHSQHCLWSSAYLLLFRGCLLTPTRNIRWLGKKAFSRPLILIRPAHTANVIKRQLFRSSRQGEGNHPTTHQSVAEFPLRELAFILVQWVLLNSACTFFYIIHSIYNRLVFTWRFTDS